MMNFKQLIAKYASGNLTSAQLPSVGVQGLEEGMNSASLYILAGLDKNENSWEIDYYFGQALLELDIEVPNKRKATIDYAVALVDEILINDKELITGMKEVVFAIKSYDFFSESKQYCFDSIGFEKVYGLYDDYDDLSAGSIQLQDGKTATEVMAEIRGELLEELKQWKSKINDA